MPPRSSGVTCQEDLYRFNSNANSLCILLGVRVAVGAHQSNVDGLDHRPGRIQPLRGDLHAVSGDPDLYDATIPPAGARERHKHHCLQRPAIS